MRSVDVALTTEELGEVVDALLDEATRRRAEGRPRSDAFLQGLTKMYEALSDAERDRRLPWPEWLPRIPGT